MVRAGLRVLLEGNAGMHVTAEADNGRSAVRLASEFAPDVVIMDIRMPDLNGVEATRQIVAQNPGMRVIVLSAHPDGQLADAAMKAGAAAFLPKDDAFADLATAINTVIAKRTYLSPRIAGLLASHRLGDGERRLGSLFDSLTPREREVLQLMAEGKATKQIAIALHVSVKTVETHRRQIMEKLQIFSVAELTKYAIREGLTSLDR